MKSFSQKSTDIKENDVAQFRKQMFNAKFSRLNELRTSPGVSGQLYASPRQGKNLKNALGQDGKLKSAASSDLLEKVLIQTLTAEDITKVEEAKENLDKLIKEKKISEELENKPMYYTKENEIPTAEYFLRLYTKSIKSNVQKIKEEKTKFKQIMDFINSVELEKYMKASKKMRESSAKRSSPPGAKRIIPPGAQREEGKLQQTSTVDSFQRYVFPSKDSAESEEKWVQTIYTQESEGGMNTKRTQNPQLSVDNILLQNLPRPSKRPSSAFEVKGTKFSGEGLKHIKFAHPSASVNFQSFLNNLVQQSQEDPNSLRASPEGRKKKKVNPLHVSQESLYTLQEARRYMRHIVENKWKEKDFQEELIKKRREIKITKIFRSPFTWDNHVENTVVKNNSKVMLDSPVMRKKTGEFVRVPKGKGFRIFKPSMVFDFDYQPAKEKEVENDTSFKVASKDDDEEELEENTFGEDLEEISEKFGAEANIKIKDEKKVNFPRRERKSQGDDEKVPSSNESELSDGELRDKVEEEKQQRPMLQRQNSLPRREARNMTRIESKSINLKGIWKKEIVNHGKYLRKSTFNIEKNIKRIGNLLQETSAEKERIKSVNVKDLEAKLERLNKRMNYNRKKKPNLRSVFMKSYNTIEQAEKNNQINEIQKQCNKRNSTNVINLSHFVKSFI